MIKNILVPVDGSVGSDRAVAQAISIASLCESKINFLYVANINQLAINAFLSDAILAAVKKAGEVILERAVNMVPSDIKYETFSQTGSPAVTILDFEKQLNSDLIVMGSRGLGLVKGVLLGSVSQYIVEQATCPVLVVK
ncbi:MAG: universal stress protein [Selenomonadaceae bacterium]|nr:universal stress protein [Selenomonadaceae bacterium]MBR1858188.1 universal stress protein [Selenomonadaceae bacterium]